MFSDEQLLWLRDMTLYVSGGEAIQAKMHVFQLVLTIKQGLWIK